MNSFSIWKKWNDRIELDNISMPGVYIIAFSEHNDFNNCLFNWEKEIIYIGMTISKGGLKNRLKQFDSTLKTEKFGNHGGAQRVKFKYKNYEELVQNLYVSINSFNSNVNPNDVKDLLTMGKIVELEFICLAEYLSKFKELPEFNDKKRSRKN